MLHRVKYELIVHAIASSPEREGATFPLFEKRDGRESRELASGELCASLLLAKS